MRVVIVGGTGFLGMNLARALCGRGAEVVLVSRNTPAAAGPWSHEQWDGRTVGAWAQCLDGADAVVNLAGRSVDCVKTPDHCDEILRSRVEATTVLGAAMGRVERRPGVWVQMSTAHIYGDPPTRTIEEDSALGYGLAPEVGKAWERAFREGCPDGVRGVVLRTSFVLGRERSSLQRLARLARWGLGGRAGHGKQGISWIHEDDMDALFLRAIDESGMNGVYIATSPDPVSYRVFMRELRRAVRMPVGLPASEWMVRLGASLVLRTDPELALYGRYCRPKRLLEEGFGFRFPKLGPALQDLLSRRS